MGIGQVQVFSLPEKAGPFERCTGVRDAGDRVLGFRVPKIGGSIFGHSTASSLLI